MGRSGNTLSKHWRTGLYLCVTSALLLEIVLRIWAQFPSDSPIFVSDLDVGFRSRPHSELGRRRTNSFGFNDVEHPSVRHGGVGRIAFIGDSFVFGVVPRRQNMVAAFDRLIREGGARFDVLNMGIPAAGPENYLGVLQHDAIEQQADVIVVVFFIGNDVLQSHPDFKTRVWFGAPRSQLRSPYLLKLSADYLYSLKLLRGGWRLMRNRMAGARIAEDSWLSEDTFFDVERRRLEICLREQDPRLRDSYRGAAELIDRMQRASDREGRDLLVILAPDRFQVEAELKSQLLSRYGLDPARYDFDQPQRILVESFNARGVEVLDLLPAFRRQDAGVPLYLPRNTHWNARGNQVAAERIAAWFFERIE